MRRSFRWCVVVALAGFLFSVLRASSWKAVAAMPADEEFHRWLVANFRVLTLVRGPMAT
jgi:hypothetical protein